MKKPRLQHVSCSVPADAQNVVRTFYGEVLGLEEKSPPKSLADQNLVWFAVGDNEMELHFLPNTIQPDPEAQYHFCLEVADLEQYRNRLVAAGHTIIEGTPIPNRPRFFCRDPFHNLIEFTTILGHHDGASL